MEPDVWMGESEDHYDCITVYINNLLIESKDLADIINILVKK